MVPDWVHDEGSRVVRLARARDTACHSNLCRPPKRVWSQMMVNLALRTQEKVSQDRYHIGQLPPSVLITSEV